MQASPSPVDAQVAARAREALPSPKFLLVILAVLLVVGAAILLFIDRGGQGATIYIEVFADKTLQAPLEELLDNFKGDVANRGITVEYRIVYGSSGFALSQLELRGRGDLYVADGMHFPKLGVERGVLDPKWMKVVGYIHLVLLVQEGNPKDVKSLMDALSRGDVRIAVGNPEHVTAGVLAFNLFRELGLEEEVWHLVEKGRIVLVGSASEAATQLLAGNVDVAITFNVYEYLNPDRIDSVSDPIVEGVKAEVVVALPKERGPLAEDLFKYIVNNRHIFAKYGVNIDS